MILLLIITKKCFEGSFTSLYPLWESFSQVCLENATVIAKKEKLKRLPQIGISLFFGIVSIQFFTVSQSNIVRKIKLTKKR